MGVSANWIFKSIPCQSQLSEIFQKRFSFVCSAFQELSFIITGHCLLKESTRAIDFPHVFKLH